MTAGGRERTDELLERDHALATLRAALGRSRAGIGSLVVIEAGAGEGKTALLRIAAAAAGTAPLVLADDAHHLDAGALVELRRRSQSGTAVIVAFRPGEPGADDAALDRLRSASGALRVALGPLSAGAVATLVHRRLPLATDDLVRRIHELTAGNPLYVEELLAGDPQRTHILAVGDRMLRRAGSQDGPALLLAMAALGDGERLSLAAEVAGISPHVAEQLAHQLSRMQILAGEDPYSFAQPLVRQSVYRAVTDAQRTAAHAAAAQALAAHDRPAAAIAAQLSALPPSRSEMVSAGLLAAADAATGTPEAIGWLRRALAEGAPAPPRAELLERLGTAEMMTRDAAAIDHLREALDLTVDPVRRARLALSLAEILAHAGQWEEAVQLIASFDTGLDPETDELSAAFTAMVAVSSSYDTARVHIFNELRPRFEELAHGTGWGAHALRALLGQAAVQRGEDVGKAIELAESALADGVLLGEQDTGGWATPQLLGTFVLADRLDRALAACAELHLAARAAGSPYAQMIAAGYRGWTLLRGGDLARGEAELRRVIAMLPDPPLAMVDATFYYLFADALVERPSLADVAAAVERMQLEPAFLGTWSGGMVLWARGLLRLAGADRERGIADMREVGKLATALGYGPAMVPWRSRLALALSGAEHAEALELVAVELRQARASGLARPLGIALSAAGIVTGGEAGLALQQEAVEVLADSPARFEHARALIALGSALRRARHPAEGRASLQAGLELATACGAVRLATDARAELSAAAGRPPRREPGDISLTGSELRLARLAVAGASNRQIADELFISLKTVETHLSNIYAKFGLTGRGARAQLATALKAYEPLALRS